MNITVNGKARDLQDVATVADLLRVLELDSGQVVVELNERIVRRNEIEQAPVSENDRVEILRFVGGG
jgi:thiamine biosynthesis protein ThiS